MTITLTEDLTNQLLDAAVEAKGAEYVYLDDEGHPAGENYLGPDGLLYSVLCQYVRVDADGEPIEAACLVGDVLHRAGVPLLDLRSFEGQGVTPGMLAKLGVKVDDASAVLLVRAQGSQDDGYSWGDVVLRARDGLAEERGLERLRKALFEDAE